MALRLAVIACLAAACGGPGTANGSGGGGADSGASPSGSTGAAAGSGPVLWSASHLTHLLKATDSGSGQTIAMLEVPTDPTALAIGASKVWLGTDDGDLRAIDPKSGDVVKMLHIGGSIEHIVASAGAVFVAHFGGGSSGLPPEIVHVDPAKVTEVDRFAVVDINDTHDGLILDGTSLLVLVGNGFAIARADAQTGKVDKQVPLGEDPNDPKGPRGAFYGYGSMSMAGAQVIVLDEDNNELLDVDASTLELKAIHDAASWLKDGGATDLVSDGERVFVSLKDSDSVVRIGQSGDVDATYQYKQGAGAIAYKDGKLYMNGDETTGDVLVIDSSNGKLLRTVPGVFADNLLTVQ